MSSLNWNISWSYHLTSLMSSLKPPRLLVVRLNVTDVVVILLQLDDRRNVGAGVTLLALLAIATSPNFYLSNQRPHTTYHSRSRSRRPIIRQVFRLSS
eukprot:13649802-Heterocapsa_arctica.AAC.1